MGTITFCDRCEKNKDPKEEKPFSTITLTSANTYNRQWDICQTCENDIIYELTIKKKGKNNDV